MEYETGPTLPPLWKVRMTKPKTLPNAEWKKTKHFPYAERKTQNTFPTQSGKHKTLPNAEWETQNTPLRRVEKS